MYCKPPKYNVLKNLTFLTGVWKTRNAGMPGTPGTRCVAYTHVFSCAHAHVCVCNRELYSSRANLQLMLSGGEKAKKLLRFILLRLLCWLEVAWRCLFNGMRSRLVLSHHSGLGLGIGLELG